MSDDPSLIIHVGDRVTVEEGSWAGRKGTVVPDAHHECFPGYVLVRFEYTVLARQVRACTLAKEVNE